MPGLIDDKDEYENWHWWRNARYWTHPTGPGYPAYKAIQPIFVAAALAAILVVAAPFLGLGIGLAATLAAAASIGFVSLMFAGSAYFKSRTQQQQSRNNLSTADSRTIEEVNLEPTLSDADTRNKREQKKNRPSPKYLNKHINSTIKTQLPNQP